MLGVRHFPFDWVVLIRHYVLQSSCLISLADFSTNIHSILLLHFPSSIHHIESLHETIMIIFVSYINFPILLLLGRLHLFDSLLLLFMNIKPKHLSCYFAIFMFKHEDSVVFIAMASYKAADLSVVTGVTHNKLLWCYFQQIFTTWFRGLLANY